MNGQQINELATICTRYADLKSHATSAYRSLVKFRMGVFKDMITEDEFKILKQAEEIADRIRDNTSTHDAIKYFNSLQNA